MLTRWILIALFLLVAGCSSGQAGALDECSAVPLGHCTKVQTCCNSTDCYFLVDDKEFFCDNGKNCDAAVAKVESYCGVPPGSS